MSDLANEFRQSWSRDVMEDWGVDAVYELRRLSAANTELLNALTVLVPVVERNGIPCDAARAVVTKHNTGEFN